jgi:hypothetical protein
MKKTAFYVTGMKPCPSAFQREMPREADRIPLAGTARHWLFCTSINEQRSATL